MKKTLSAVAIALCCGAGVNAATPAMSSVLFGNPEPAMEKLDASDVKVQKSALLNAAERRQPQRAIKAQSAQDFIGNYKYSYQTRLQDAEGNPTPGSCCLTDGTFTIVQDEVYADSVVINLFINNQELIRAGFDAQKGCLVIPPQYYGPNTYYNRDMWFFSIEWKDVPGEEGYIAPDNNTTFPNYIYFTGENQIRMDSYRPEGGAFSDMPEDERAICDNKILTPTVMMAQDRTGYFMLGMDFQAERQLPYEWIDAEWEDVGMATYKDIYFPMAKMQDGSDIIWEVKALRNKTNPCLIALDNPYGAGTPLNEAEYVVVAPNRPGHIIFDTTNPDVVCMYSGVYTFSQEGEDPDSGQTFTSDLYCYNVEGYYHFVLEDDINNIIVILNNQDKSASWMADDNKLEIYNGIFGLDMEFNKDYSWKEYECEGWVEFADGVLTNGVESVVGEDNNAPAEYYTLQGVRVNNPAKGQVVIVRKGNKAYKTIAK